MENRRVKLQAKLTGDQAEMARQLLELYKKEIAKLGDNSISVFGGDPVPGAKVSEFDILSLLGSEMDTDTIREGAFIRRGDDDESEMVVDTVAGEDPYTLSRLAEDADVDINEVLRKIRESLGVGNVPKTGPIMKQPVEDKKKTDYGAGLKDDNFKEGIFNRFLRLFGG
jgi:hypothetical protein